MTTEDSRYFEVRHMSYVLAIFTLTFLLLLAWRTEVQADGLNDQIARFQQNVYEQCLVRLENVRVANAERAALSEVEQNNTFVNQEIREKRVSIYRAGILTAPHCRKTS